MELVERVRNAACDAVHDCSLDRISAVRRFEAGDRHAVFRVSYLDPSGATLDFVVRVSTLDDADAWEHARREAEVLALVQGVAAPLLYDVRRRGPWLDSP